jgi:hypothetical protein
MTWRKFEWGTTQLKPSKLHVPLHNIRVQQTLLTACFNKLHGDFTDMRYKGTICIAHRCFCMKCNCLLKQSSYRVMATNTVKCIISLSLSLSPSHTHQQIHTIYIKSHTIHTSGVPRNFVGGQQIQLRTEGRENGVWGRYPPSQGFR